MKAAIENSKYTHKTPDFWLNEEINSKNIFFFIKFLADEYPHHRDEFLDVRKKLLRGNKSVLSILIAFSRTIDKKNENLVIFTKKLIQTIMDNPKGFKR